MSDARRRAGPAFASTIMSKRSLPDDARGADGFDSEAMSAEEERAAELADTVFSISEMVDEIVTNGKDLRPTELIDLMRANEKRFGPAVRRRLKDPAYWEQALQLHFGHTVWGMAIAFITRFIYAPGFDEFRESIHNIVPDMGTDQRFIDFLALSPLERAMSLYSFVAKKARLNATIAVGNWLYEQLGRATLSYVYEKEKYADFSAMLTVVAFEQRRDGKTVASLNPGDDAGPQHMRGQLLALAYEMSTNRWGPTELTGQALGQMMRRPHAVELHCTYKLPMLADIRSARADNDISIGTWHRVKLPRDMTPGLELSDVKRGPVYRNGITLYVLSELRISVPRDGGYGTVAHTVKLDYVAARMHADSGSSWTGALIDDRHPAADARHTDLHENSLERFAQQQHYGDILPVSYELYRRMLLGILENAGRIRHGQTVDDLRVLTTAVRDGVIDRSHVIAIRASLYGLSLIIAAVTAATTARNAHGIPNMYRAPAPAYLTACATCGDGAPTHVDPAARLAYCGACVKSM